MTLMQTYLGSKDPITRLVFKNIIAVDGLATNTYTFTNVDLGPAYTNRVLLICVNRLSVAASSTLSTVGLSIGGQAMTLITSASTPLPISINPGSNLFTFYISLPATMGTSANIVFTSSGQVATTLGLSILSFTSIDFTDPLSGYTSYTPTSSLGTVTLTSTAYTPLKNSAVAAFTGGTNMTNPTFSANLIKQNSIDSRTSEWMSGASAIELNNISTTFSTTSTVTVTGDVFRFAVVGLK